MNKSIIQIGLQLPNFLNFGAQRHHWVTQFVLYDTLLFVSLLTVMFVPAVARSRFSCRLSSRHQTSCTEIFSAAYWTRA